MLILPFELRKTGTQTVLYEEIMRGKEFVFKRQLFLKSHNPYDDLKIKITFRRYIGYLLCLNLHIVKLANGFTQDGTQAIIYRLLIGNFIQWF